MLADPDLSALSSAEKDALIRTLLSHLHDLSERVTALEAENAVLRDRLNLPPKTPRNSSTPPSQGHKANGEPTNRRRGKGHPGVCVSARWLPHSVAPAKTLFGPRRSANQGVA